MSTLKPYGIVNNMRSGGSADHRGSDVVMNGAPDVKSLIIVNEARLNPYGHFVGSAIAQPEIVIAFPRVEVESGSLNGYQERYVERHGSSSEASVEYGGKLRMQEIMRMLHTRLLAAFGEEQALGALISQAGLVIPLDGLEEDFGLAPVSMEKNLTAGQLVYQRRRSLWVEQLRSGVADSVRIMTYKPCNKFS